MTADPSPGERQVPFDALAARYERFADVQDDIYRPWLTHVLDEPPRGGRAVDLGCGSGRFTGLLADRYGEVLAVDVAARELAIARAKRDRPNIRYEHRGLLDVTPGRDGRFDLVLSVNTIHLLNDHARVLPHLRDLVAPGGRAVLVDIVCDPARWATRRWHYAEGVRSALKALGRRHSVVDSFSVLRLRLHPVWINQVTKGTPLSRGDFHRLYAEVFPAATFNDDLQSVSCAITWRMPPG